MFTSPTHTRPGSGASTKIPTDFCASTCPRGRTCRCSRRISSTTSPGASTCGQEKLWDGKRPLNCFSQKALSTSSNTGQLKSNPLHLELESAHPALVQHQAIGDL